MKARFICSIIVIASMTVFSGSLLFAQEDRQDESRTATIEELYLSQDIDLQIARTQALADSREMKELALQTVRNMIDEGLGDTAAPELTAILNSLATEGTTRQVRTGSNTVVNNYPSIRRQAVELIWQLGGSSAEDALKGVMRDDDEPMVLAEAVYGLGRMDISNPEEISQHFVYLLRRWNAMEAPDNNLAFATLLAVERIAQSHPDIAADPELINTLLGIAAGNYIREVRLKSIDVISGLRRQGR